MQSKQLSVFILLITSTFMSKCSALPVEICYNTGAVEFIPHSMDCSLYILCVFGVPTILECQQGSIFNSLHLKCEPGKRHDF